MHTESYIYDLLTTLDIKITSATATQFIGYCPFHANTDTPAFAVNKTNGSWCCFNYDCGQAGGLKQLIEKLATTPIQNVARYLGLAAQEKAMATEPMSEIEKIFAKQEIPKWKEETLDSLVVDYDTPEAAKKLAYLLDRGFSLLTLKAFEIGFSEKKQRIVIPVRDENYRLVGVIGRAVNAEKQPKYLYSDQFPKRSVLFNLCHAKTHNEVIIVEGSLDTIKLVQAGYQNTVAVLGSSISDEQAALVNKTFNEITIFADNDPAGQNGLVNSILTKCPRKHIYFAKYEPEGPTDPGGMSNEELIHAIENRESELDRLCRLMWK